MFVRADSGVYDFGGSCVGGRETTHSSVTLYAVRYLSVLQIVS